MCTRGMVKHIIVVNVQGFSTTVCPACHVQSSPSIKFSRSIPVLHTRSLNRFFDLVGSLAGGKNKRTPVNAITIVTIAIHVCGQSVSHI